MAGKRKTHRTSDNAAAIASMLAGAEVVVPIRGRKIKLTAPTREAADEAFSFMVQHGDQFLDAAADPEKDPKRIAIENPARVKAMRELNFLALAACLPDVPREHLGQWFGLLDKAEQQSLVNPALDLCGIGRTTGEDADSGDFPSS